jgi:hypothetical protein
MWYLTYSNHIKEKKNMHPIRLHISIPMIKMICASFPNDISSKEAYEVICKSHHDQKSIPIITKFPTSPTVVSRRLKECYDKDNLKTGDNIYKISTYFHNPHTGIFNDGELHFINEQGYALIYDTAEELRTEGIPDYAYLDEVTTESNDNGEKEYLKKNNIFHLDFNKVIEFSNSHEMYEFADALSEFINERIKNSSKGMKILKEQLIYNIEL